METQHSNPTKWHETMTVKMVLLGLMAIMFLIPLQLIKMVIKERESNSAIVKQEISEQWGKMQIVSGPVLNIPLYSSQHNMTNEEKPRRTVWHILPDKLDLVGNIKPEIRYKGIYETVIYDSDIVITGEFIIPESKINEDKLIKWDEAYITMGVSDNRGLRDDITISLGNKEFKAEPGLMDNHIFSSGISFPYAISNFKDPITFYMALGLKGSDGIYFSPVGKTTSVKLSSTWDSPSFGGQFLPSTRTVDKEGFTAEWLVTHLNRNFPREWTGAQYDISGEIFGADLILEVDHYQKSERSAKYGLLFIAFTFMVLIFIELTSEKRIHIFSYFLVSLALILFFSMLNALSEHIGFNPAYIISSAATIALITGFSGSLIKSKKTVISVGGLLSALYVFLFFLLSLNEYAYLAGNIGLFIGLAAVMWFTSRTTIFQKGEI